MKKFLSIIAILSFTLITSSAFLSEAGAQMASDEGAPAFTVTRLLIAGAVEDREPVGVVNAFAASTEKVYCFLEANDVSADTTVSFVWYHNDQETAAVSLQLGKSKRWRTYSSKKLGGRTGEWKVELQDAAGNVIDTTTFTVE